MPKISALTAATTLTADDYLVVVDDPAGTPTTKRITAANAATYFGGSRTVLTPEGSGAAGNAVTVFDAAVTNGDATLTSASSVFTGRSGQAIYVAGAGAAGATLATTILSVTNATTVELNTNASTTVTAATAAYGTNDTSALNTWLALGSATTELVATPGVSYLHAGLLTMTGKNNVLVRFDNARVVATVQTASAVQFVNCDDLEMTGGLFELQPPPTSRGSTGNHNGLYFEACDGLNVAGYHTRNAHAAGTLIGNCSEFEFRDVTNEACKADGFHMTGGSRYGRVYNPRSINPGDDGVAVVSYNTGEAISHDIEVVGAVVHSQTSGRGVAVVGGSDIAYTDIDVTASAGAGVYIANESSFTSYPTSRVRVAGGRITQANQLASLDHGAVFVYNSINGSALTDVTVENLEIRDTRASAGGSLLLKNSGSTGTMSRILFRNLRLVGDRPETDYGADGGLSATRTNITHGEGVHQANWKDTDYTLALTDAGDRILCASASNRAITVPPNSSVAFPKHTTISVVRMGAGTVTITAGSGVTLRYKDAQTGNRAIQGQYAAVELWQAEVDEWVILGSVDSATTEITELVVALSDETTALTTGTAKLTMRMPYAMTLTAVRSSINTVSSSGLVTVDINEAGTSILSTKLSIDQGEKTSTTAATPAVISDSSLADDAEITFDIDAAGTGAQGLKVAIIGTRGGTAPPTGIEFVASSNTTYATRTTTTVTKPTGTVNGDYILLGVTIGTATEAVDPTPPAGFTLLTGFPADVSDGSFNVETRIYGRFASGEGASWDFTHSSSASQGFAMTYRGVNTGTPIDLNSTINSGTGNTSTATGFTTVTNGAMVVYFMHDWGSAPANRTAPTGTTPTFTERWDQTLGYVADGIMTTAGATGNKTQTTNNSGGSDSWAAALIALRPA